MGCIPSKSSNDEQPNNHEIRPNHHSSNDALEFMVPKHEDMPTVDVDKEDGSCKWSLEENKLTIERCSRFHTVEEYNELLQRISSSKDDDGELVGFSDTDFDQPITDTAGKKDGDDDSGIKENKTGDVEFQTVASLRQWLHSPRDTEATANADTGYPTTKFAFGFYDNMETPVENLVLVETCKKQEDETNIELVVAFDRYMQQLQIDEDKILKHIHNMID